MTSQLEADLAFARGLQKAFRKLAEERQRVTGQANISAHEHEISYRIEQLAMKHSSAINLNRLASAKDVETT